MPTLARKSRSEMTIDSPRSPRSPAPPVIRAPRGNALTCRTWQAEAAMRMLMNNLDPEVAERPEDLIVYGGRGQAARSWPAFYAIIDALKTLAPDQTLLVQSGKPVGIVQTHEDAPRVLIANSNLVPHWATQEHFDELARKGLIMFGQMTAGSWIYIGTQGILQGTYETFAELARTHFNGTLAGRLCVTAGCGGMGGAQPLAVTLNQGVCLIADVDVSRLFRRQADRYLDDVHHDLDAAIDAALDCCASKTPRSIGVDCNAIELLERLLDRGITPDALTDQTSAHDPLNGYVPIELTSREADIARKLDPEHYTARSLASMERHVRAMVALQSRGAITFDYGNNIRQRAFDHGFHDAFSFPGFVPAFIRPQFCLGRGPFRWVALSGDPRDIFVTDYELLKLFPLPPGSPSSPRASRGEVAAAAGEGLHSSTSSSAHAPNASDFTLRLHNWILGCHANPEALLAGDIDNCKPRFGFQGLPARICWLGLGERDKAGLLFNDLVRAGRVKAPIVIGRDHLDCGSVASPNRETESMKDGSDAISDWAILNALMNTASGATWVSFHHGGGVGIGFSQHAGQVIVADGTPAAAARLKRVLTNDPLIGVLRHADAGYEEAKVCAAERGVQLLV